jgi:hypothetical protein
MEDDMSIGERLVSFDGDEDKLTEYYNGQIDEDGLSYDDEDEQDSNDPADDYDGNDEEQEED